MNKEQLNKAIDKELKRLDKKRSGSVTGAYLTEAQVVGGSIPPQTIGCKKLLGTYTFSRIHQSIEVKCGDIIWNELENTKKRLLCSECQSREDEKVIIDEAGNIPKGKYPMLDKLMKETFESLKQDSNNRIVCSGEVRKGMSTLGAKINGN